jgi:hypothetical protein
MGARIVAGGRPSYALRLAQNDRPQPPNQGEGNLAQDRWAGVERMTTGQIRRNGEAEHRESWIAANIALEEAETYEVAWKPISV